MLMLCVAATPATAPSQSIPANPTATTSTTATPATQSSGRFERDLVRPPGTVRAPASISQPSAGLNTFDLNPGRVVLALGTVLALIVVMRFLLKRFFPHVTTPKTINAMRVLSRLPINPKQQLLLIQVGKRMVVVGNSGTQLSQIAEISDPDEVAQLLGTLSEEHRAPEIKSFVNLFGKARQDFDDDEVSTGEKNSLVSDDSPEEIEATKTELHGLISKVRDLSTQFRKQ